MASGLSTTSLPGIPKFRTGKVRDVYDLGDELLIVATDRLSTFDVVLPSPIPDRGRILNQLSAFWFERFAPVIPNHVVTADFEKFPAELLPFRDQLAGRSMVVHKTKPLPVECVVRGYLAGSAWKDYHKTGAVCGITLPWGLAQSVRLDEPLFTPSTKAEKGHDENISQTRLEELVGSGLAEQLAVASLDIYRAAREYAEQRGVVIADTKFEFGMRGGRLMLIDELLTPDSSRFWDAREYRPGRSPPSFDKQFARDFLERSGWNKQPPAPLLPPEIIEGTRARYLEAFRRLTGREPD